MKKRSRLKNMFSALAVCVAPLTAMADGAQTQDHPLANSGNGGLHELYVLNSFYVGISILKQRHGDDLSAQLVVSTLTAPDRDAMFNHHYIWEQSKKQIRRYHDLSDTSSFMVVCNDVATENILMDADNLQRRVLGTNVLNTAQLSVILRDIMPLYAGAYLQLRAAEAVQREQGLNPDDAYCKEHHPQQSSLGWHLGVKFE